MEELVKLVSQKTGVPESQAKIAVEIVVGFLKDKLPAPIAGQIEGIVSGAGAAPNLGDLTKGPGGLLGKQ